MGKKLTKEEFVEKARKVHGNRYGYDKVIYLGSNKKVVIICYLHNIEFFQEASSHLRGVGCPECGGTAKSNADLFIEKAIKAHGNLYNYSKVVYINSKKHVIIICKKHNKEFLQTPTDHLSGYGCRECGNIRPVYYTTEEFIEKAKLVHGDDYDYSKSNYKKTDIKLIIICKKCNEEFLQIPNAHLSGHGCPKCSGNIKYNTDEFIEKAKLVHGDKYDYSKAEYKNNNIKILIICKKHNKEFFQSPNSHLCGQGCPRCHGRVKQNKWLDFINIPDDSDHREVFVKINNKRFYFDGYDYLTKTIYEFHGDFWHGNPNKYDLDKLNSVVKKTFGELYRKTIERKEMLETNGYRIISIWESDWDILNKGIKK